MGPIGLGTIGRCASAALLLLALSNCAGTSSAVRVAHFGHFTNQAGFTQEEQELIDDNCPMGIPTLDSAWPFGPTNFVVREGYVLQHCAQDKIPIWVCEHLTPEELAPGAVRHDVFATDPKLAGKPRAELADYKGSGYDRGHQAPAGDQNSSQQLKNETFFLSNMAPQAGALNQQVWARLEDLVRSWVENHVVSTEYILTGGMFYDPTEENSATADGLINYLTIGAGHVAVPTHFYKVVVAENDAGEWRGIAFVLENRGYGKPPYHFETFVKPIRWIEERTGIDFMPDLDPAASDALETDAGALWSQ